MSELVQGLQDMQRIARLRKTMLARENLLDFIEFTSPDPEAWNDVERSTYKAAAHHRAICQDVQDFLLGKYPDHEILILTVPPRHGKSEIVSRRLPAWLAGKFPTQNIVVGTYNDDFAADFGDDVRRIIQSKRFKEVFPTFALAKGGTAKDRLKTTKAGQLSFVGRGGSLTGRGAHVLVLDDIIKDDKEAASKAVRDSAWNWFARVAMTRRMGDKRVIMTFCLTGDTAVLMADGEEKPLRDIRPGDMVASYDRGRLVASKILNHINNGPDYCYEIRMTSGVTVKANERHPFLVDRHGELEWIRLKNLRAGDAIVRAYTSQSATERQSNDFSRLLDTYEITTDRIAEIRPVESEDVYDVQVDRTENFIANGLVSHNTRWHSDDPIGRLTDPENEFYSERLATRTKIINLPAIAEQDDPLGREPGEALWPDGPDRFDADFLAGQQSLDPIGFSSLYQQRPTVEDGILFRRENVRLYTPEELPEDLRYYCASDHAVTTAQRSDFTCLGKVGVDRNDHIWLMPDLWWQKARTDAVVEAMLLMGSGKTAPLIWWAEKGHISKSIGPFLKKRMLETGRMFNLVEVTPSGDKEQRAQSISARMALGMVHIPAGLWWTDRAVNELLAFPNARHDDFVDFLAYIGLGLRSQVRASPVAEQKKAEPRFGTYGWIRRQQRFDEESLIGKGF